MTMDLDPWKLIWCCRSNDQDLGGCGYVRGGAYERICGIFRGFLVAITCIRVVHSRA